MEEQLKPSVLSIVQDCYKILFKIHQCKADHCKNNNINNNNNNNSQTNLVNQNVISCVF